MNWRGLWIPNPGVAQIYESQTEAKEQAHAAIARARNALFGLTGYPDATFTLRLAFGVVKGWEENGAAVPALTTVGGLYAKATAMKNQPPLDIPQVWEKRKSRLDSKTPFNFVSTCRRQRRQHFSSPVVNRAGDFVGIIFDGNLQSLSWDFAFSDVQGRATSVDSAAILAALKNVYQAPELVKETDHGTVGVPSTGGPALDGQTTDTQVTKW